MRICFLIEKIGPYHAFRLQQLKDLHPYCIETRPDSQRYAWKETVDEDLYVNIKPLEQCSYKGLSSLLSTIAPDVLFVTGYGFKEMLWAMAWGIKKDVAIVLQTDSTFIDEPRNFLKESIKKKLISFCSAAFVAGTKSWEYVQALGMPATCIFEPYDIVNNEYYARNEKQLTVSKPYLLCISRLLPQKNLFFLLEVFYEVKKSHDIDLVILGSGPLEKELNQFIQEKQLQSSVFLKGFLHQDDVRSFYHHAEALVLASTSEPWGLCINEAMAAGLPILASHHCGAAVDLIKPHINGITFSPFNVSEALNVVNKYLQLSKEEKQKMGVKSKEIISHYNGDKYKNGIIDAAVFVAKHKRKFKSRIIAEHFVRLIATNTA